MVENQSVWEDQILSPPSREDLEKEKEICVKGIGGIYKRKRKEKREEEES